MNSNIFFLIVTLVVVVSITIVLLDALRRGAFPRILVRGPKGSMLDIDTNPAKNNTREDYEQPTMPEQPMK